MEKKTFGTLLAQGAVANAMVGYVLVVAAVLYHPNGYNFLYMAVLPFYLFGMGIVGAAMGGVVWLSEWLFKRKLGILPRAAVGIIIATLFFAVFSLWQEFIVEWRLLGSSLIVGSFLGLPAALMAESKFNPLRSMIFGLSRATSFRDFGSGFSFPPGLLLRVGSLFGLLESLLFLACLAPPASAGWSVSVGGETFVGTIVAILYFTASVFVSFTSPRKPLLLGLAVLVNAPLAMWTVDPHRYTNTDSEFFAIVIWVFISLWVLLVVGRLISIDNKREPRCRRMRFFPLTMLEIEIRHALNKW